MLKFIKYSDKITVWPVSVEKSYLSFGSVFLSNSSWRLILTHLSTTFILIVFLENALTCPVFPFKDRRWILSAYFVCPMHAFTLWLHPILILANPIHFVHPNSSIHLSLVFSPDFISYFMDKSCDEGDEFIFVFLWFRLVTFMHCLVLNSYKILISCTNFINLRLLTCI